MGNIVLNSLNIDIPIIAFLMVGLVMFFSGIYGFFVRRNLIMILISVELILNAVDLNFAVFNRYLYPEQMEGMFFALFTIAIAACETAVAIAIIINVYRRFGDTDVTNIQQMKE